MTANFYICTDEIPVENQIPNLKIMKQTLYIFQKLVNSQHCLRSRSLKGPTCSYIFYYNYYFLYIHVQVTCMYKKM